MERLVEPMALVYIVDDEPHIRRLAAIGLKDAGFETAEFSDGSVLLHAVQQKQPDAVLLDWMMPGQDGLAVLRAMRENSVTRPIPIIMMTARADEVDRVLGLELGADDYVTKPFSLREVIARVKAVLRRTATMETEKAPERLTYQSLVIDITKKKVSIDDEEVQLTKKEFEILLLLVQNKGRVFSREDILARIWSDEVYVLDRTIDVNITRLRKKIGEYGKCIVTRLGYGYCFEAE